MKQIRMKTDREPSTLEKWAGRIAMILTVIGAILLFMFLGGDVEAQTIPLSTGTVLYSDNNLRLSPQKTDTIKCKMLVSYPVGRMDRIPGVAYMEVGYYTELDDYQMKYFDINKKPLPEGSMVWISQQISERVRPRYER